MICENPQREFALKLDRLPEEVPTEAMEAYLIKYVKNPKMQITIWDLSEHGLGKIKIGEATVTHKGLRRVIPRMVWVGPGVRARVTSMTEKPWDSYKVICSLCKGEMHKEWDCPTLPRQWSLITISQDNHSFHPMFPTDHCRLVSIFSRKVRWRSEHVMIYIYAHNRHLSFDVAFICSTLTHCGVCHLRV